MPVDKIMETNHFDQVAKTWDENPIHTLRTKAIADKLLKTITFNKDWKALEYGSGTGLLSFALMDHLAQITLMDNSVEMNEQAKSKIKDTGASHLKTVVFNLEHEDYKPETFDLIFSQMVLHHVKDIDAILLKFNALLNTGGYIAIADLYTEDGTFHGADVDVHHGFDPETLLDQVSKAGFTDAVLEPCYDLRRPDENQVERVYPIFLLVARKG